MFESPVFPKSLWVGGLLILLCVPIGWPVALGYRSLTLRHLITTGQIERIEFPKDLITCFRAGLGAVIVILVYFLPFTALYWILGLSRPEQALQHVSAIFFFFALIALVIPMFLPSLPIIYPEVFPWINFTTNEVGFLIAVFLATVFLMPAVFMQVSLAGSYWGAARLGSALRSIIIHPLLYIEAWLFSLLLVACSFILVPLFPWLTFWSYLAIGFVFNNVLAYDKRPEVQHRLAASLSRFRSE